MRKPKKNDHWKCQRCGRIYRFNDGGLPNECECGYPPGPSARRAFFDWEDAGGKVVARG